MSIFISNYCFFLNNNLIYRVNNFRHHHFFLFNGTPHFFLIFISTQLELCIRPSSVLACATSTSYILSEDPFMQEVPQDRTKGRTLWDTTGHFDLLGTSLCVPIIIVTFNLQPTLPKCGWDCRLFS